MNSIIEYSMFDAMAVLLLTLIAYQYAFALVASGAFGSKNIYHHAARCLLVFGVPADIFVGISRHFFEGSWVGYGLNMIAIPMHIVAFVCLLVMLKGVFGGRIKSQLLA
ncbi:hypothetical protein AB4571_16245 [Vibrio breoganii]|uniref:hypothetical protein n=1 Tax=Vibrio breoganii TaxID=553239 RepID=UPI000C85BD33|nr:hypothetical protein [Vibrio breoganii]PML12816.1 hypothetical protein BCT84_02720 [Vibrio breoganii]